MKTVSTSVVSENCVNASDEISENSSSGEEDMSATKKQKKSDVNNFPKQAQILKKKIKKRKILNNFHILIKKIRSLQNGPHRNEYKFLPTKNILKIITQAKNFDLNVRLDDAVEHIVYEIQEKNESLESYCEDNDNDNHPYSFILRLFIKEWGESKNLMQCLKRYLADEITGKKMEVLKFLFSFALLGCKPFIFEKKITVISKEEYNELKQIEKEAFEKIESDEEKNLYSKCLSLFPGLDAPSGTKPICYLPDMSKISLVKIGFDETFIMSINNKIVLPYLRKNQAVLFEEENVEIPSNYVGFDLTNFKKFYLK